MVRKAHLTPHVIQCGYQTYGVQYFIRMVPTKAVYFGCSTGLVQGQWELWMQVVSPLKGPSGTADVFPGIMPCVARA